MKKLLTTFPAICLIYGIVAAQETDTKRLPGWVRDSVTFEPLAGAHIRVLGREASGVTDAEGKFEIRIPASGATLEISHAEFNVRLVPVKAGQSSLSVLLTQRSQSLQEVVVYNDGYSRTIANKATGSYARVSNEQLNDVVETNIMDRLKYMTNGLTETPSSTSGNTAGLTLIRGFSTLTMAIQKPLIIMDNFEFNGDVNSINPNDVEDIVVLKDAAAAAIWGARAANGVIIINTRKGKLDQPVKINLTSNLTIVEKPDLHKIPLLSTSDLIDIETFLYYQGYYDSRFNLQRAAAPSELSWLLRYLDQGVITEAEAEEQINKLRTYDVRNDYEKYFYRQGISRQNALSVSGGSHQSSWRVSGGWDNNIGNQYEQYNRVTLTSQLSVKLNAKTDFNTTVFYAQSRSHNGRPGYLASFNNLGPMPSYTRFADENGNPLPVDYLRGRTFLDTVGRGHLLDWKYYPLTDHESLEQVTRNQNFSANFELRRQVVKGLDLTLSYRYSKETVDLDRIYGEENYYTRDLINRLSQADYPNNRVIRAVPLGAIRDYGTTRSLAQNIRGQLNYRRAFGADNFSLLIGGELSETEQSQMSDRMYGFDPLTLNHVPVNYVTLYRDFASGGSNYVNDLKSAGYTNNRLVSVYANGSYSIRNKYTFSGSARRDASNLFGVNINNKWKPLWSAGFAWDLGKEKFYQVSWLPHLRIRTSIGHQGNMDPSKVAVTTILYGTTNSMTLLTPATIRNYPHPNLRWERTSILNLGVEMASRENRVRFSAEFYNKNIRDLYVNMRIDPTAGLGLNLLRNAGEMWTRGIELQLNTVNIRGKLTWETDIIANHPRTQTTKYRDSSFFSSSIAGAGLLGIQGFDAASYFAYRWGGLDPQTGDPIGYLDGAPSKDYAAITGSGSKFSDFVYIGSFIPKWTGSVGNTLRWMNIRLSFRMMGSFGYYFQRPHYTSTSLTQRRGHPEYLLRWQKPGDELHTQVPSFKYPINDPRDMFYSGSEHLAERGDHVRLQFINLSYEPRLGQGWRKVVNGLSFAFAANNLGVIWKATSVPGDPQTNMSGLPPRRTYTFRLSANF